MTREPSPPEPLVSSTDDAELRALLEAGRDELPSAAELEALAAKLGPILGPRGSGGGHGGAAAAARRGAGAAIAKALGGVTLALVVGGAGLHALWGDHRSETTPSEPTAGMALSAASAASSPSAPDEPVTLSPPVTTAATAMRPTSPVAHPRGTTSPVESDDPDAEVKLLQRAQTSLQNDPTQTLALCADHARRFPNGFMAEEREVLAIEALVGTGRGDEARARADRFAASYPSSTHLQRIHTVLAGAR